MYPRVVRTTLAATLALGVWLLAGPGSPAADEDPSVAKDLQKLVDKVKGGKAITEAEAKDFAKKHEDLEEVMNVFKPPAKDKEGGIEKRIMALDEKGISKEQAAREKAELVRAAQVSRAIAQLLPAYAPSDPGKAKDWKKLAQEMGKGADGFEKAVQKGDPAGVKAAA